MTLDRCRWHVVDVNAGALIYATGPDVPQQLVMWFTCGDEYELEGYVN